MSNEFIKTKKENNFNKKSLEKSLEIQKKLFKPKKISKKSKKEQKEFGPIDIKSLIKNNKK